ncbi:MAG: EAL domain-containing protein [Oceanospirillales bacterium]|nr:MAG: EAL domain-containing protein [Oceanospirillales bacterium]
MNNDPYRKKETLVLDEFDLSRQQSSIIDAAGEMIATITLDERILFVNHAGRKLLAISQEHNLASEPLYVSDFHTPEVYALLKDHIFPSLIKEREMWQGDIEFKNLNNQTIPVNLSVIPHYDESGKVAWITGIARDLSEQNALEIQQRLAKRVFDNTIEGIFVTDSASKILQVNRAFCEITGYSASEVIGNTPRILQSKHHELSFYEALWQQVNTSGTWQGEIWNRRKDGSVYLQWLSINSLKNKQGDIEYFVAVFHDLSELRAREAQIEFLVNHDPLTELGNRTQFIDRLKYILQSSINVNKKIAVIKIDLGEIQLINDSLGHAFCDRLIQQAAKRLKSIVKGQNLLVRLAADEFGVLVVDIKHAMDISRLVFELKSSLQLPFKIDDENLYMNPSLGIALYPDDANSSDDLLRFARIALQQAKGDGRNTFCFYNPDMSNQARERLLLEQALREAITSNGLSLNFQPKVLLKTGEIFASEVLVRWNHPTLGYISPSVFIPMAERSGLISDLGRWVMNETCRCLAEMKASGLTILPVAINLSVYELESSGFAKHLMDYVNKYHLEPCLFEFEVTETGLISREEMVIESLKKLRNAGFKVALDDFGTGYSSLSYLRKLPLTTLKIDRAFVNDITDDKVAASIVRTVISLTESLSLEVIAEGVETKEQQSILLDMGCSKAQGYFFYKPLSTTDFKKLLKNT